jgi:hypothetical protein
LSEATTWTPTFDEDESWGDESPAALAVTEKKPDPSYSFYGGEIVLYFNVDKHQYYRFDAAGNKVSIPDVSDVEVNTDAEDTPLGKKVVVPGVTTVLGIINKPFLKQWAVKLALLSLTRDILNADGTLKTGLTAEQVSEFWEKARYAHKDKLNTAGDIGTLAHDGIEEAIKYAIQYTGGVVTECPKPDPDHPRAKVTEENLRQATNADIEAFKWMQAHNVRFIRTERKIYSREFDFSGTLDGEALVDSCDDPMCKGCRGRVFKDRHSLIDWKTSNSRRITRGRWRHTCWPI